jgi:hypothetical protein
MIMNVLANCKTPRKKAMFRLPMTGVLTQSRAQAVSATYRKYQTKNATVRGKANPLKLFRRLWNSGLFWVSAHTLSRSIDNRTPFFEDFAISNVAENEGATRHSFVNLSTEWKTIPEFLRLVLFRYKSAN